MNMNICEGITLKGKRCSRKVSNGLFCGQHKNFQRGVNRTIKQKCNNFFSNGKPCTRFALFEGKCKLHKEHKQFVEEKPDECPVCYETFSEKDKHLACGHWIHLDCVKKSMKAECPICRKPVNIDQRSRTQIESRRRQLLEEGNEEDFVEYQQSYQRYLETRYQDEEDFISSLLQSLQVTIR